MRKGTTVEAIVKALPHREIRSPSSPACGEILAVSCKSKLHPGDSLASLCGQLPVALRIRTLLGKAMHVTVSHHIDASEPDANGFYDYYYEYDDYRFSLRERTYTARVADQPERASYIGCEESGRSRLFNVNCSRRPPTHRRRGLPALCWHNQFDRLSIVGGYVPLDMPEISPQTHGTNEVSQKLHLHPIGALRDLAIGTPMPTASTSDHDDLYDEHGVSK